MLVLSALVVIVAAWILIALKATRGAGEVRQLRRGGGDIGAWSAEGPWLPDSGGSQHGLSGCGGGSDCGGGGGCGGGSSS